MYRKFIYFVIVSCLSFSAAAADVQLRNGHPETYVVKKGDTLWDISGVFLNEPWLWPEIWHVNPQVENPHLIYPGDLLTLAFCDGKPCLKRTVSRNVKLSPNVRATANEHVIPPIPLDVIRPFLSRPRVVGPEEMELAPYVISSQDEHLIAGADNKVYVRGLDENDARSRYTVFRSGEVYRDLVDGEEPELGSDEGEILGYEALYLAEVEMTQMGDPASALVTRSSREILVGDRLMPEEDPIDEAFIPHPPAGDVNGRIISVVDGVSQIGQYQIAVLNLGAIQGMEPGHVLAIHEKGRYVRDTIAPTFRQEGGEGSNKAFEVVELPEERIGELMVFRVFDKVSYALVMRTERPAHIYDAVYTP